VKPAGVMNAIVATEGRLVWADPAMGVVVVDAPAHARWDFYAHGAPLVSGAAIPRGCFNWSKAVVCLRRPNHHQPSRRTCLRLGGALHRLRPLSRCSGLFL